MCSTRTLRPWSAVTYCYCLGEERSYSTANEPSSVRIFTNTGLLPTLFKFVISDGEANQTILDGFTFASLMPTSSVGGPLGLPRLSTPSPRTGAHRGVNKVTIFVGMPCGYERVMTLTDASIRNCKGGNKSFPTFTYGWRTCGM